MTGLLPIAVRAPEPVSALAIFYNEETGAILERRYLDQEDRPYPSADARAAGGSPGMVDRELARSKCRRVGFLLAATTYRRRRRDQLPRRM